MKATRGMRCRYRTPRECLTSAMILALGAVSLWAQLLAPGTSIEGEIRGGQTHSFPLRAGAGQFIHVALEQKGVDVRLRILGPDRSEVAQSDFPNADWGPEVVAVVAASPGDYTVE